MSWILFALTAALIWSVVNIADKIIISRLTHEPVVPVILLNGIGIFVALGIVVVRGVPHFPIQIIGEIFLLGVFAVVPSYCYFTAAKGEEISRLVPLFQLSGLFTAVIAAFTLHEVFTARTYVSIVVMVVGALFISSKQLFAIKPTHSFWWMIGAAFTFALYGIILKHILQVSNFWDVFAAMRVATFLLSIPLGCWYSKPLRQLVVEHGARGVLIISVNEFFSMSGVFVHAIASSLGPITLVNAITGVQPLFVLVLSVFVTLIAPQLLKEEVDPKTIARKLIATALILGGARGIT